MIKAKSDLWLWAAVVTFVAAAVFVVTHLSRRVCTNPCPPPPPGEATCASVGSCTAQFNWPAFGLFAVPAILLLVWFMLRRSKSA